MSAPKHQSHIARRYSTGGHPTLATAPCKASWGGVGGSGALSPLFSPGWAQSSCPASPVGPGSTGTELPDELGGGGCQGPQRGLRTPDRSRTGQPLVPGAHCEPGLAAGRAEEAEHITGLHLEPGWGSGVEHSQGRAWEQQDGEHSLCQHPQSKVIPPAASLPSGSPGPLPPQLLSGHPFPLRAAWVPSPGDFLFSRLPDHRVFLDVLPSPCPAPRSPRPQRLPRGVDVGVEVPLRGLARAHAVA